MNHQEFIAAIAATIGKPEDKPGEWELAFPHGGKLWVKLYPDTGSPWIAVQFREWPKQDTPDGANPFSGKWNTHITMPGGPKTPEDRSRIYEDTVRDFTRKLARVGWTPPAAALAESLVQDPPAERQAGLPDDGSWQVSVYDGKYTVCFDGKGKLTALRYGEPWQDLVGNNLVYWLAVELREAREKSTLRQAVQNLGRAIEEATAMVPMEEGDEEHPLWCIDAQIRGLLEGDGATEDLEDVKAFFRAAGLPESTAERVRNALCSAEVKAGLPEPVAWAYQIENGEGWGPDVTLDSSYLETQGDRIRNVVPLYKAPAAGLTAEEKTDLRDILNADIETMEGSIEYGEEQEESEARLSAMRSVHARMLSIKAKLQL